MKSFIKTVVKMATTIIIAIIVVMGIGYMYRHAPEIVENTITGVICFLGVIWGIGSMMITITGEKID